MTLHFIRDIQNYFFSRSCFDLLKKNPVIKKMYGIDIKVTKLGVMYFFMKVPKSTPDGYVDEFLTTRLATLDTMCLEMGMDGVAGIKTRLVSTDANDHIFLIKLVPYLPSFSLWNLIKVSVCTYIAYKVLVRLGVINANISLIDNVLHYLDMLK